MAEFIRDVIDIPTSKPSLVVKVGEIDDDERKAYHAREYVITPSVAEGLRRVVGSVAESADKGFPGQGVWVSGSFGTGKSHFLSFAGLLLRNEPAAWERKIPGLPPETRALLENRPVLVVPFNTLDRPDDFRLGLYDAVNRELGRQGLPAVELTYFERIIAWFEGLAADTPDLWKTFFSRSLVVTSPEEYEARKGTPQGRELLAQEIVSTGIAQPPETTGGSFAVEVAEGVRRITRHLQAQGFAAVLFLVDELTLFLINAQDKNRPMVELKALLEAEGAALPVWALVVRHAPLEDVVREVGKDILDNVKGRFMPYVVDIKDQDLYQILGQRVLRPVQGREHDLDKAVQASLEQIPPEQMQVLYDLYGQKRFRQAVRALYPFHPAIVDTLVSVTHLLSRERTALSVMYDMLFDLADEPLGTLIPYHRAFHYLIERAADGELQDRPALLAAKAIMRDKVTPLLEEAYLSNRERVEKGLAVAQSIILGQLTDKGVPLRGRMTPAVLAALNAAVLNAQVVILAQKQLEETIALLCDRLLGTFKREGEAIVVELTLGLDPMEELRRVKEDVAEWRRRAVLDVLNALLGIDPLSGQRKLNLKWRGTNRSGSLQAIESHAGSLPPPEAKAEFGIWVAFPRFAGDPPLPGVPKASVPVALWVPKEAGEDLRQQLDSLARIRFLTESPAGRAYVAEKYSGEEGKRLAESWTAAAIRLQENLKKALTELYGQGKVSASSSIGERIAGGATLQDAARDLAGRLLDARFRQHPEFTGDVTPQALESLYLALVKGDGKVGPEAGAVHGYAAAYGLPLRIVKSAGTAYTLDLGNSPYVQEIEEALKREEAVKVGAVEKRLADTFGLQPYVAEFLLRLMVVFRDLRVLRGKGPLAMDNAAQLNLDPNDVLTSGQRVGHGEWAAFAGVAAALGLGQVPEQPTVRHQDAAWAKLGAFVEQRGSEYEQLRKQVAQAAKPFQGAPPELEQALGKVKATLDSLDRALTEPTSEAGIRVLAKMAPPERALPEMLEEIRKMAGLLQDAEVRNLYEQLPGEEARVAARIAVAQYVAGQKGRKDLLDALRERVQKPAERKKVRLRVRFADLRAALESIGVQPEGGWEALGPLDDEAEVTVEVYSDAQS